MVNRRGSTLLVFLLAVSLTGCGADDTPPLGLVTGTITLDGVPLEGVIVIFKPESGRAATGTTNTQGEYELEYAYGVEGCKTGPNQVMLEWPLGSTQAKALSPKYTTASELTADVKSGSQPIDFKLESDSQTKPKKIVIPD